MMAALIAVSCAVSADWAPPTVDGSASGAPDSPLVIPADWEKVVEGETVEVSGRVRRLGSDPFSYLVVTDEQEKDWYLDDAATALLKAHEQQTVKVRGVVALKRMTLANGKELGIRRILERVALLE